MRTEWDVTHLFAQGHVLWAPTKKMQDCQKFQACFSKKKTREWVQKHDFVATNQQVECEF